MDVAEHLDYLASDGPLLAHAAARAGWDAPVPGTAWNVRELVTHVGGVRRWATEIVRTAAPSGDTSASRAVGAGPPDPDLLEWFHAGHRALLEALGGAPADLDCFAFLPAPSPLAFWARRQAHETAMHRADAQAAAGLVPEFDASFAQDGIAEMLTGFARRRSNAIHTPGQVLLCPVDEGSSWLITFGGEQITGVEGPRVGVGGVHGFEGGAVGSGSVASVSGISAELYLWLWNRQAKVEITGDAALVDLWRTVRVRWS
ncbi:MAG: maleylpyruvate isomerase family mycothiol-dependent enzyme [Actinomycetota bacterium]|nr:maleylpyruvate isomerase family mycothiol-dependent enzyme [Actinomycetota bacterium]